MDATTETAAPASEAAEPSVADAIRAAVEEAAAEPEEGTEQKPADTEKPAEQKPAERPPEPTKPADDRVVAALRGAARREGQALRREQAAKAVEGKAKAFDEFSKLLSDDPVAAFKALGLDARGVFQRVIDKGEPPAPTPETEIAELKKWRDQREASERQAAQDRSVNEQKAYVAKLVTDAGDKFELINANGEHDLVWESMLAYYTQHETAPDPLEIAAAVEEHLAEKAERALKTKRFATRINAQPSNGKPQQPIPGETTIAGNRATPVPSADDDFPLDDHERMKAVLRSLG